MRQRAKIADKAQLYVAREHLSCDLGNDLLVWSAATGSCQALGGMGKDLWQLLQHPTSLSELVAMASRAYDVPHARCRADIVDFLAAVSRVGLVQELTGEGRPVTGDELQGAHVWPDEREYCEQGGAPAARWPGLVPIRVSERLQGSLLLQCLRRFLAGPSREGIATDDLGPSTFFEDWLSLPLSARQHSVSPQVASALVGANFEDLPFEVMAKLESDRQICSEAGMYLAGELMTLLREFSVAGVPVVPHKGPMLSLLLYGQVCSRQFGDLDLLVPAGSLSKAIGVLARRRYRPDSGLGLQGQRFFGEYDGECVYVRAGDGVRVDLHWRVAPCYDPYQPAWGTLVSGAVSRVVAGQTVTVLAPEKLAVCLCVHGAAHGWSRLGWLLDVAVLFGRADEATFARMCEFAVEHGAARRLRLGVLLAATVIGSQVPERGLAVARKDRVVAWVGRRMAHRLVATMGTRRSAVLRSTEAIFFDLLLLDDFRSHLHYLAVRLLRPNLNDWRWLRIPVACLPMYALLKPVRLFLQGLGWRLDAENGDAGR